MLHPILRFNEVWGVYYNPTSSLKGDAGLDMDSIPDSQRALTLLNRQCPCSPPHHQIPGPSQDQGQQQRRVQGKAGEGGKWVMFKDRKLVQLVQIKDFQKCVSKESEWLFCWCWDIKSVS